MNALQLYQFYIPVKTNINLLEASDFQVQQMRSLSWACPHGRERMCPRPLTQVPAGPQCCKGKAFPLIWLAHRLPTLDPCQCSAHLPYSSSFQDLPSTEGCRGWVYYHNVITIIYRGYTLG